METVKNPKTKLLDEGEKLRVKQMETLSGQLLPKHKASEESVLVVIEGVCVLKMAESEHTFEQGDSVIIPSDVWHQIKAIRDFKAIHIMPKAIRFEFTK
ncbi:MAG: cupin domain-containing protein [Petrimonas sp.]|jgi:quercetin dioxygenase-like cupin family protein|nr:cupin domain-containing protein [Petrimonas sp.]